MSATTSEIIFERSGADYPTRIVYRRDQQGITAEISGPANSRRQAWRLLPAKR